MAKDVAVGGINDWKVSRHVLMTGPATFEYEGRFDPKLFASVA